MSEEETSKEECRDTCTVSGRILADTDQNNNTDAGSKLTAATTASAGQLARRRISPLHGLASLVPRRALGRQWHAR